MAGRVAGSILVSVGPIEASPAAQYEWQIRSVDTLEWRSVAMSESQRQVLTAPLRR